MNRRATTLTAGIVLLVALVLLALNAPVKYITIEPGQTFDTLGQSNGKPLITVTGAPETNSAGQLRMVTIGEVQGLTTFDVIKAWLNPNDATVPREVLIPEGQTEQQNEKQSADDFANSQAAAATVALRHEGYPVSVIVKEVTAGQPADGHLQSGDVVTAVNGQKIISSQDLIGAIQSKTAGTPLTFDYTRDGKPGQTVIKAESVDGAPPQIGIKVDQKQPSPISVKFDLDNVGGPSAGLMFTLGIIDKIDPTDLTGGKIIAGTGTMDDDGNVGPIGGIPQKLLAAHDAGAHIFLTPADNCAEALGHPVEGLELVKVSNIDDALKALQQIRDKQQPTLCTK
jgi:PDZ domain-containing protein